MAVFLLVTRYYDSALLDRREMEMWRWKMQKSLLSVTMMMMMLLNRYVNSYYTVIVVN